MSKSKVTQLDNLARIRLSKHFFLRDFLYSETAAVHGINNIPDDIDLAVAAGSKLCEQVLEPILAAWGRIHIRSAFRSCEVNQLGNELGANCASNEKTMLAIYGTGATNKALWGPPLVLLSLPIWNTTKKPVIGHH